MKTYQIEIEEILQNVYEIEAKSLEEAISIAEERYSNEEYVLEPECIKETNFREFPNPVKNKERER